MADDLKNLIKRSQRILITTHFSPDPDAISSLLLVGTTLLKNFPDKQLIMHVEDKPVRDISFLNSYSNIEFLPLIDAIKASKPDLIIMVDANNFDRVSRSDAARIRAYLKENDVKSVIIDHHQKNNMDDADLYINNMTPATAQEVYQTLFHQLDYQKPPGYAETTLLGIISDSFRFMYHNPQHRQTFAIVSDLLDAGASIEKLENRLGRYSKEQLLVFSNLAKNISDSQKGYSFSFIDDYFSKEWFANNDNNEAVKMAAELFTSQFIRNYEDNDWGFIVYPEFINHTLSYSVSFRSLSGVKDVSKIAFELGGGGHKAAAGAKNIEASDVHEAVLKVEAKIAEIA